MATKGTAAAIQIQWCFMVFPQESGMDNLESGTRGFTNAPRHPLDSECSSQALNSNDDEPALIDRCQTFCAKDRVRTAGGKENEALGGQNERASCTGYRNRLRSIELAMASY